MFGTQLLASATALRRGRIFPSSDTRSLHEPTTRRPMVSPSNAPRAMALSVAVPARSRLIVQRNDVLGEDHVLGADQRRIVRRQIAAEQPYAVPGVGDDLDLGAAGQGDARAGRQGADVDRAAHSAARAALTALWRHGISSSQLAASMNCAQRP